MGAIGARNPGRMLGSLRGSVEGLSMGLRGSVEGLRGITGQGSVPMGHHPYENLSGFAMPMETSACNEPTEPPPSALLVDLNDFGAELLPAEMDEAVAELALPEVNDIGLIQRCVV